MTNVATETRSIVVERDMTHPPEKIWRALTQSALIEEWLMKNDFFAEAGFAVESERRFVIALQPPPARRWPPP